jgi:hypothetical protein
MPTGTSDDSIAEESKLYPAILLGLTLALGSGETGKEILKGSLKETLRPTELEAKRFSRPSTTWIQTLSHYGIPIASKREAFGSGLYFFLGLGITFKMGKMLLPPYMTS